MCNICTANSCITIKFAEINPYLNILRFVPYELRKFEIQSNVMILNNLTTQYYAKVRRISQV